MKRLSVVSAVLFLATLACALPGQGTSTPPAASPSVAPIPNTPSFGATQEKPTISNTQSPPSGAQETWAANLAVASVNDQTVGPAAFASSTRLLLAWHAPEGNSDHYLITATKLDGTTALSAAAPGGDTTLELDGLDSGTTYEIALQACLNADCSQSLSAEETAAGTTSEEYWQLQGEGHSYETAIKVVQGGNNIPYVIVWGPEAGPELSGKAQLYYHPFPKSDWSNGVRTAVTTAPVSDLASLSHFLPTESGLQQSCDAQLNPDSCPPNAPFLATFQAVPLAGQNAVRLYFEIQFVDNISNRAEFPTRYYSLDSQDGFQGQDFNPRPDSSICGGDGSADYSPGGDCEPTLVLGVEGDSHGGDSGLIQARQSKVGYPQRDSWAWDGAPGTFMVVTGADACGQTQDGLLYATWDGARWQIVKDANGCAMPLVLNAHGPVLEHLGDGRYKLYYEDATAGRQDKPFRMVYADATLTGDPGIVDFDDWENAAARAREVHFLWPDGSPLDAADESGLGDHMILAPTDNLEFQVMYMNLGGMDNSKQPGAAQGIGIAVLLNP